MLPTVLATAPANPAHRFPGCWYRARAEENRRVRALSRNRIVPRTAVIPSDLRLFPLYDQRSVGEETPVHHSGWNRNRGIARCGTTCGIQRLLRFPGRSIAG